MLMFIVSLLLVCLPVLPRFTIAGFQGFEVVVAGRKYFAFSKFEKQGKTVISYCNELMPGWSHDSLGHDWACYVGKKVATVEDPAPSGKKLSSPSSQSLSSILRFETG